MFFMLIEISLLEYSVGRWKSYNRIIRTILISSVLRRRLTVLTRTCTSCSATGTPTPWSLSHSAPTQQRNWKPSSTLQMSPSSRTEVYLTVHVPRSACKHTHHSVTLVSFVLGVFIPLHFVPFQEMIDIKRFLERQLPAISDEWTKCIRSPAQYCLRPLAATKQGEVDKHTLLRL